VNVNMPSIPGVTAPSYGPYAGGYRSGSTTRGYASGTSGASSGWAWVGEQGPELVRFSGGESVIPNGVSRGYAGGTGDLSLPPIIVQLDGRELSQTTAKWAVERQRRTGTNGYGKRTR
jgi:hypothetical protein